jgi:DNA-binding transcriptional regulator YhcF (GntR family)
MQSIRLNHGTGVPVFRQIVEQIAYMIELGQLNDGDRLPSSRMLAANLHVNRNTVARAYGELSKRGLVGRQGRLGMIVRDSTRARDRLGSRESARLLLSGAVSQCLELGLAPDEIADLAYQESLHAKRSEVEVAFVECNAERAETFAVELGDAIDAAVTPLVLGAFALDEVLGQDLVVTTFFHLAEVRRLVRAANSTDSPEVLGIVVGPHLKTLVRLSQIPKGHHIGIYYTSEDQSEAIRQSLADTGVESVDVITGPDDPALDRCDLVIVPSESPELGDQLRNKVELLEFGNVLDASSVRMVSEVLDEVRERKGSLASMRVAQLAAAN